MEPWGTPLETSLWGSGTCPHRLGAGTCPHSLSSGDPWDPFPPACSISILLSNPPPTLPRSISPNPLEINVIIAMCACLRREWVSSPPPSVRFPKEHIPTMSGLVPAEHSCAGGPPPPNCFLSVITLVVRTCACVCHSGDQQVRKMKSSQHASLGKGWVGRVLGDGRSISAPCKRTLTKQKRSSVMPDS